MTKKQASDPAVKPLQAPLALAKAQKGSRRSMWELLVQLRVLIPYLTQLAPLLDRGLRPTPGQSEVTKGIAALETGSRDLQVQARNQALQLERIEQQMSRLREVHESSIEESRRLLAEVRSLRHRMLGLALVTFVFLIATIVMLTLLLVRST